MKKVILYIPAIIFTFGVIALNMILADYSLLWYIWLFLFWSSAYVMSKGKAWGAVIGCLPGIHFIYMSRQFTGQVINIELPLGFIIISYYIVCGLVIWKRRLK